MCKAPKMLTPAPPPPPPQEAKAPNFDSMKARRPLSPLTARTGMVGTGLLTGTTGVAPGAVNLGGTQLLGGGTQQ